MNKVLIISLIMTTFYMEGCVSNNEQAIKYFDAIYLPIQEVVELDNQFQEQLHGHLIATDEVKNEDDLIIDGQEYDQSISDIKSAHTKLTSYLDDELIKLKAIKVYNNETTYQRVGIELLTTYSKIAESDFVEMMAILSKEDLTEEDNTIFNELLKHSSEALNLKLDKFYDTAVDYGDRYEIDLEFDED